MDAASIIELAGVVPRVRIDALLRLLRGDLAGTSSRLAHDRVTRVWCM
jgi:hypothetical protein